MENDQFGLGKVAAVSGLGRKGHSRRTPTFADRVKLEVEVTMADSGIRSSASADNGFRGQDSLPTELPLISSRAK